MTTAALAPLPGDSPQRGTDDDFTGLFRSYHPQLLRYVTHHFGARDADEITQETLTRALRSLDRGRSEAETWAWLIRVARNIACDFARSRRICEATDDDAVLHSEAPSDVALPEPAVLLEERRSMVRRALKVLPPSQRRILVLYEVDDLNCPTIASLVGSSEDAVRKALQRARRRFAAEVQALGGGSAAVTWWLRVLRRRPRGMSALTASTALCAMASGVVLTVTSQPVRPENAPRLPGSVPVAVPYAADVDMVPAKVARPVVPPRAAKPAVPAKRVQPAAPAPTGPTALITMPKSPLTPGTTTRSRHVVYTSAGNVIIDRAFDQGRGPVCPLLKPTIDCGG